MTDVSAPKEPALRERVAEEIRVLLVRRRMSATQLARLTGMTQQALSRRLTGQVPFDVDDLDRIATTLGVPIEDLLPSAPVHRSERGNTVGWSPKASRPGKSRPTERRPIGPSGHPDEGRSRPVRLPRQFAA